MILYRLSYPTGKGRRTFFRRIIHDSILPSIGQLGPRCHDFDPWGSAISLCASGLFGLALVIFLFSLDSHNKKKRDNPSMALFVLIPYIAGRFLAL